MHFRKIRETDSISHIKNKSTIVFNMGNNFSKDSFDKKEKAFEEDWQDYLNNGNKSRCFHATMETRSRKKNAREFWLSKQHMDDIEFGCRNYWNFLILPTE